MAKNEKFIIIMKKYLLKCFLLICINGISYFKANSMVRLTDSTIYHCLLVDSETGKNLPFVQVNIYKVSEDKILCSSLSNRDGFINIKVADSIKRIWAQIKASCLRSDTIAIDNENKLKFKFQCYTSLTGVTILGNRNYNKPFIKVYKVTPLKDHNAPNVTSFLKTIPEVSYINNDIKIYGNKNVDYYLNGMESDKESVINLPISIIDRIELVSNNTLLQGSNNGNYILNIITKKQQGIQTGTISSLSGSFINKMVGASFEPYILKKNFFASFTLNSYESTTKITYNTVWKTIHPSNLFSKKEKGSGIGKNKPIFISSFIQNKLSKNISSSFNVSYQYINQNSERSLSNKESFDNDSFYIYSDNIDNIVKGNDIFISGLFDYKYLNENHLYLNVAYDKNKTTRSIIDRIKDFQDMDDTHYSLISTTNEFTIQLTHSKKYNDNISHRIGFFYDSRPINSILINNMQTIQDSESVTNLNYKELTYSVFGYVDINIKGYDFYFGGKFNKIMDKSDDQAFENRLMIVPQLFIYKDLNKGGIFNLSAYSNVSVPNKDEINPGSIRISNDYYSYGGSELKREITYNFDLTHDISIGKQSSFLLNSDFNYKIGRNILGSKGIKFQKEDYIFYSKKGNIGNSNLLSMYVGVTKKLKKNGIRFKFGFLGGKDIYNLNDTIRTSHYYTSLNFNFTTNLFKYLTSSVSIYYKNFSVSPYSITKLSPSLSYSLSGQIIESKLYANFYWSHILNIGSRYESNYRSYYVERLINNNLYAQNISISLTYYIGKRTERESNFSNEIDKPEVKQDNAINKY